jgi:hypothetical protein
MVRPGRENGTPAEPENVDCGYWTANASASTNNGHLDIAADGRI